MIEDIVSKMFDNNEAERTHLNRFTILLGKIADALISWNQFFGELIQLHNKYPYLSSYELSEICKLSYKTIQRIRKKNNIKKVYMPKSQKKTLLMKLKKRYQEKKINEGYKERRLQKKKNRE